MKTILILLAVVVAISIIPIAACADGHDQAWRDHHQQVWRDHEKQWRNYDRQWLNHRNDWQWREDHVRMWADWYQWHRDNESYLNIRFSDSRRGPCLDIDYRS